MKYLISIMLVLILFPIEYLLLSSSHVVDGITILYLVLQSVQAIINTLLAYLCKIYVKKNKTLLHYLITLTNGVLFGILSYIVTKKMTTVIVCIILSYIVYRVFVTGNRLIDSGNQYIFVSVSFVYLLSMLIGFQAEVSVNRTVIGIVYSLFCLCYIVTINQNRLVSIIHRRTQNMDSIPKGLFKYNLKIVLTLFLLITPIIALANPLGDALYNILISILKGIVYLGKVISYYLKKDTPIETPEEDTPKDWQPYQVQQEGSLVQDITLIVGTIFLIWLIYYYRNDILYKLREINQYFKTKLKRSFSTVSNDTSNDTASKYGYVDHVEDVTKDSLLYKKKKFKKCYKEYLTMECNTNTYIFGYDTLLCGLEILGYSIYSYDTVTDVSNKCNNVLNSQLKDAYLSIRYNNTNPTTDEKTLLDDTLKSIYKKI